MPGRIIPSRKSAMVRTFLSNSNTLIALTRVATRLVEFLQNVLQGRQTHGRSDVGGNINLPAKFLVGYQLVYAAFQVLCHLLYDVVTFRMHGGMIQRIFSSGDAEESWHCSKALAPMRGTFISSLRELKAPFSAR